MKFGTLILLFLTFSRFCNAMQITDIEGKIITLTAEQAEAFKQCALYKDYQEHTANESLATLLPAINSHLESNPAISYTLVKQTQEQALSNELQKIQTNKDHDIYSFQDCTNLQLVSHKIIYLLNFIHDSSTISALPNDELADFFELSLYMGAPEHKIGILAQHFYEYIKTLGNDLRGRVLYFKKCAVKYLTYYPTMGDFIEDFNTRYAQNFYKFRWQRLFNYRDTTSTNFIYYLGGIDHDYAHERELDLSYYNLHQMGFTKQIHSLDGLENLAKYLDCATITGINLDNHKISNFFIDKFQKIFPKIQLISLANNKIEILHKDQFKNLSTIRWINLNVNPIRVVNADFLSLTSDIKNRTSLFIQQINSDQLKDIYLNISWKHKLIKLARYYSPDATELISFGVFVLAHILLFKEIYNKYPYLSLMVFPSLGLTSVLLASFTGHLVKKTKFANPFPHLEIHCANGNRRIKFYSSSKLVIT